jgi:hypothetical protein
MTLGNMRASWVKNLIGRIVSHRVAPVCARASTPVGTLPGQRVWTGIQAGGFDPGAAGVYAIGRGRGVYAVGLDAEGVFAHSWSTRALCSD